MIQKIYLLGLLVLFSGCINLFSEQRISDLLRDPNKELVCNTKLKLNISSDASTAEQQFVSELPIDITMKWNLDKAYMKLDISIMMLPFSIEITEMSNGETEVYLNQLGERRRLDQSEAEIFRENLLNNILNTSSTYGMIKSYIEESNTINEFNNKLKNKFLELSKQLSEEAKGKVKLEKHECKIENRRR